MKTNPSAVPGGRRVRCGAARRWLALGKRKAERFGGRKIQHAHFSAVKCFCQIGSQFAFHTPSRNAATTVSPRRSAISLGEAWGDGMPGGLLAIRSFKRQATNCEAIQIRRLCSRVTIRTDGTVQVIRHDEQDVLFRQRGMALHQT